ncbi:uncharacterized protein LOC119073009 [Bradysia coprophila]|uniref:uncharacterized protein LOC119073009 n=1 Tax=Bradysia coprophila TaxID=38358 RepID=UPI00187D8037|nr:uncharacterized protein LOC119073009 [Bradysia coprophila]
MLSGPSVAPTSSVLPPARIKVEPRSPQGGPSSRFPLPYTGKGSKSKGIDVIICSSINKTNQSGAKITTTWPSSMQRIKVERRSPQAESSMSGLAYSVPSAAAEKVGRKRKSATVLPPRARLRERLKTYPHFTIAKRVDVQQLDLGRRLLLKLFDNSKKSY